MLALASLGKGVNWRRTWQPSMLAFAFALAKAGAPGLVRADAALLFSGGLLGALR